MSSAFLIRSEVRRRLGPENVNRFVIMRKILVASSGFRELGDKFRSLEASVSWVIASDNNAGERNNRGTLSDP
jgi:hypothetical protein